MIDRKQVLWRKQNLLEELKKINEVLENQSTSLPDTYIDFPPKEKLIFLDYMDKATKVEIKENFFHDSVITCQFIKDDLKVIVSFDSTLFRLNFEVFYLKHEIEFFCDDTTWAKELLNNIYAFKEVKIEIPNTVTVPEMFIKGWENDEFYLSSIEDMLELTYEDGVIKQYQTDAGAV
jgi:hypothetical protein